MLSNLGVEFPTDRVLVISHATGEAGNVKVAKVYLRLSKFIRCLAPRWLEEPRKFCVSECPVVFAKHANCSGAALVQTNGLHEAARFFTLSR